MGLLRALLEGLPGQRDRGTNVKDLPRVLLHGFRDGVGSIQSSQFLQVVWTRRKCSYSCNDSPSLILRGVFR
jgi:hypothetical protein